MNELTGKKDNNSTNLSLEDKRSLMSGSRNNSGPTLAITGSGNPITNHNPPMSHNKNHVYNSNPMSGFNSSNGQPPLPPLPPLPPPPPPPPPPPTSSQNPSSPWSNNGPRYNNNEVFDGHYLLRRHQRPANRYPSHIEGDSYRTRHITALMEGGTNNNTNTQGWNSYNPAMFYQNNYQQQQYYNNNHTGFVPPPLPPPPPPPPPPR